MSKPRTNVLLPKSALDSLGLSSETAIFVPKGLVTPFDTPKGKVWIKSNEPPRKRFHRGLLTIAGALFPILRPSKGGKGGDTLIKQAIRIRKLREAGFATPAIHHVDKKFLILSDAGGNLEETVRALEADHPAANDVDRATAHALLLRATGILARLHASGFAHGRPKMRDFAWCPSTDEITILDLEERPWEVMPMATAQARDIFLWLVDLCGRPISRDVAAEAIRLYSENTPPETGKEVERIARGLGFVAPLVRLMAKTPLVKRGMIASLTACDVLKAQFR